MTDVLPPDPSNAICKLEGIPQTVFFYEESTIPRSREARKADALAKSYCRRCTQKEICLEFALVTVQVGGVWGGLNYNERKLVAAERYQAFWKERGLL